ncbi:MAG: hypothetical protein HFG26_04030 [Provencibacterium sp.]|jgi:hypothetical protein|nr:hypothetical protein [Provencibacterium sp.]
MENTEQICALLEQKCGLFREYEEATHALLACELDEMETHVRKREQLAKAIDGIDRQIEALCGGSEEWMGAVRNCGNRGDLSAEMAQVYDSAQPVFQIINRIRREEPLVEKRMSRERDGLEAKIKDSNRSTAAQASRYFSGARGSESALSGGHFGRV